ncbi:MAG: nucleotidyltransferase domain-containing protein [Clostridia bacterium]|nr:nucleotidyltransferase domain-containing protein [Clostridia bacterium]
MSVLNNQKTAILIAQKIYAQAKQQLGSRLDAVVLFGSYARNDFDKDSDLDVMVRIHCLRSELEQFESYFCKLASRLSVQHDLTVSIVLSDSDTFTRYKTALPFYQNIEREGIKIA